MQNNYNALIDSFLDNKVGIAEDFLNKNLVSSLTENLVTYYQKGYMQSAGMGNDPKVTHDQLIRSDRIYWLDRSHQDSHENAFFDQMDHFVSHLNETCYTGIRSYEFHYALYEPGSFYKRHLDQFRNNGSRAFSMIMYLNADWQEGDGGELCIHQGDASQRISPNGGKSVFFKSSELEHEVLVTKKPRMSITGWLKNDL